MMLVKLDTALSAELRASSREHIATMSGAKIVIPAFSTVVKRRPLLGREDIARSWPSDGASRSNALF